MAAAISTMEDMEVPPVVGAGVYHPDNDSPNYVQTNKTRITNSIVMAELAAIEAAILQGHSHITTDSLSSLHQSENKQYAQSFTVSMKKNKSYAGSGNCPHQLRKGGHIDAKTV
eukprot:74954-Pelagomonas_calceolata.AAC.3